MAMSVPVPMAGSIRLGQRRRVVDAVANKGQAPMLLPQASHRLNLALGQHLGHDLINPETPRDRLGRPGIIAGNHGYLQA